MLRDFDFGRPKTWKSSWVKIAVRQKKIEPAFHVGYKYETISGNSSSRLSWKSFPVFQKLELFCTLSLHFWNYKFILNFRSSFQMALISLHGSIALVVVAVVLSLSDASLTVSQRTMLLNRHNQIRMSVSPPAADMQVMVRNVFRIEKILFSKTELVFNNRGLLFPAVVFNENDCLKKNSVVECKASENVFEKSWSSSSNSCLFFSVSSFWKKTNPIVAHAVSDSEKTGDTDLQLYVLSEGYYLTVNCYRTGPLLEAYLLLHVLCKT